MSIITHSTNQTCLYRWKGIFDGCGEMIDKKADFLSGNRADFRLTLVPMATHSTGPQRSLIYPKSPNTPFEILYMTSGYNYIYILLFENKWLKLQLIHCIL